MPMEHNFYVERMNSIVSAHKISMIVAHLNLNCNNRGAM